MRKIKHLDKKVIVLPSKEDETIQEIFMWNMVRAIDLAKIINGDLRLKFQPSLLHIFRFYRERTFHKVVPC